MAKPDLSDYQEVPDRIRAFFEQYPEGSLQRKEWHLEQVGEQTFVVYTALAYRTPDDKRPAHGTAWEPMPGTTPYTRNSELMNAETSAWGRALVALGFAAKKIASAEEVRNRSAESNGKPEPKVTVEEAGAIVRFARRIDIPADKLSGKDLGPLEDEEQAQVALAGLTREQGQRLTRWLQGKQTETEAAA